MAADPQGSTANGHLGLPQDVSLADWSLERVRWQNPRIRCFLGCLRVLEDVLESNFAILHCSPRRLQAIWSQVTQVVATIRQNLAPLIASTSTIPELGNALRDAQYRLTILEDSDLTKLDSFGETPSEERYQQLRVQLCVSMGKLHGFLQDSLGQVLAADPRGQSDADYFLSRKFARDVDDAEWLDECVADLDSYLRKLGPHKAANLTAVTEQITRERHLPSPETWNATLLFLDELSANLTPRLKHILGLRAIRVDELQTMEMYSSKVPAMCRSLRDLFQTSRVALERMGGWGQSSEEGVHMTINAVFSSCITSGMNRLDEILRDLGAFIPLWRATLCQRRSLMLRSRPRSG